MKKLLLGILIVLAIGSVSFYVCKNPETNNNTEIENVKTQTVDSENKSHISSVIQKIKKNPALSNEIFSEYVKNLEEEVDDLNENLPSEISAKTDISQIDSKLLDDYSLSGIDFACGEGSCYARVGHKYLYDLFNHVLTPEYNEYLLLIAEEDKKPYAKDGGIVVPFETIRKRLLRYECFINIYPNFIHNDDMKARAEMYYYAYKNGLDNTPVKCSQEEKALNPKQTKDISNSYAIYLKEAEDKDSEYYKEIENCYNKIK